MELNFHMPTRVRQGRDCLKRAGKELKALGDRALLVTGRSSAKKSGVLDDLLPVLQAEGIAWEIFDEVEPNPSLVTVARGGELARRMGASWVMGIGGGSPMDASKAIAALATNPVAPRRLFEGPLPEALLPIIAVPTTAGTGSEVTPYSILTDPEAENKRNFMSHDSFPVVSYLDGRYMDALSLEVTIHTAVDAFSHAAEGYLNRRANPLSDALALHAMEVLGRVFPRLAAREKPTLEERDQLLYGSMVAGITISQTGTGVCHALGYPLTFYCDIPHGKANGLLLAACFSFVAASVPEKLAKLLQSVWGAGFEEDASLDALARLLRTLIPLDETFTDAEIQRFARHAATAKSLANTPIFPQEDDLHQILTKSLKP